MGANAAGQMGQNFMQTGQGIGSARIGTGQNLAQGRTNYGQQMAGNIGATTSALSQLQQQQGAGLSDIYGAAGGNLSQLLAGSGQTQGQSLQNLAAMLANISTGQSSQVAGLPSIGGVQQTDGQAGNLAAGIGAVLASSLFDKPNTVDTGSTA